MLWKAFVVLSFNNNDDNDDDGVTIGDVAADAKKHLLTINNG